jgi:hypothetical protein
MIEIIIKPDSIHVTHTQNLKYIKLRQKEQFDIPDNQIMIQVMVRVHKQTAYGTVLTCDDRDPFHLPGGRTPPAWIFDPSKG